MEITKGILYLIPVPIAEEENNLTLVYPLLESIVNSLDEFIVEDLRTARRALRKIGFKAAFDTSVFHVLNEHTDTGHIESFLVSAKKGKNIGLLSEAGMPCIADPGSEIVRLTHKKNIKVVPLYGQSSLFLALAASGLNGQNFCFLGYLPKDQASRKKKLKDIDKALQASSHEGRIGESGCFIFIETPYRNNHLLSDIIATCSAEILLCVAVNITGKSEMILTQSIADWRKQKLPDLDKQPAVFLLGR